MGFEIISSQKNQLIDTDALDKASRLRMMRPDAEPAHGARLPVPGARGGGAASANDADHRTERAGKDFAAGGGMRSHAFAVAPDIKPERVDAIRRGVLLD